MGQPVVHFEIGCTNSAKTGEFYSRLFGWQMEQAGPALMIDTRADGGIQGHITSLGHEPHNYITFYVHVDDLAAYMDQAQKLGGKHLVGPVELPGRGHFAWVADPDGNIVGLWNPKG